MSARQTFGYIVGFFSIIVLSYASQVQAVTGSLSIVTPGYLGPYTRSFSMDELSTQYRLLSAEAIAEQLLDVHYQPESMDATSKTALQETALEAALKSYTSSIFKPNVDRPNVDQSSVNYQGIEANKHLFGSMPVVASISMEHEIVSAEPFLQSSKLTPTMLTIDKSVKNSSMIQQILHNATTWYIISGILLACTMVLSGLYAKARRENTKLRAQLHHTIAELGLAKLQNLKLNELPVRPAGAALGSASPARKVAENTLTLDKIVRGLCADDGKTRMASLRELGSIARQNKVVRPRLLVILKTYLTTLLGQEELKRATNREVIMCLRQLAGLNNQEEPLKLRGLNFNGIHFEGFSLKNVDFQGCNFAGATWLRMRLRNCDLRGADFSESTVTNSELVECLLPRPAIAQQAAIYSGVHIIGAAMANPATLATLGASNDADRRAAAIAAFKQGDFVLDSANLH